MKTTVEISDPLLREARKVAAREGITLRAVIERGLRQVLKQNGKSPRFRMRDASVGGQGLSPEFRQSGWHAIRDAIYEGHGS